MPIVINQQGIRILTVTSSNGKQHVFILCIGRGNTCMNDAVKKDKCRECGGKKKVGIFKSYAGIRKFHDGSKNRRLCSANGGKCPNYAQRGGRCRAHFNA